MSLHTPFTDIWRECDPVGRFIMMTLIFDAFAMSFLIARVGMILWLMNH